MAASGVTALHVEGAEIVDGSLKVPKGARKEYEKAAARGPAAKKAHESMDKNGGNDEKGSRFLMAEAIRELLAVRVKANDKSPTSSLDTIGDKIFGTGGDEVNLVERFDACSFGQVKMKPFQDTTSTEVEIVNGVIEVQIDMDVTGEDNWVVARAAIDAATALLGPLSDQFDHVMFCLPPGTNGDWLALCKLYCQEEKGKQMLFRLIVYSPLPHY
jgi:hypothetical protein